jgi:hypothetical protein
VNSYLLNIWKEAIVTLLDVTLVAEENPEGPLKTVGLQSEICEALLLFSLHAVMA